MIKEFQQRTKYQIIKAIYAKFLSLPETQSEEFDFLDFVRNADATGYNGKWHLYFVKRDLSSDLMGLADIGTGKTEFNEGVVYELSDDKFIFNLLNFPKHDCFEMTDIFDILKKNYTLIDVAKVNIVLRWIFPRFQLNSGKFIRENNLPMNI